MAMTILNNTAAQMTLGELNKNITQVGKDLAKISKGERIYGAAASASEYAITENMRVKIRSLGQDEMNVKSGGDLMRLAEGAVQNQLNIMRTIKERVINAANDSNTDEDRKIIQKEINQFLNEIEDITYETNYNKRPLLYGNIVATREILKEWDEQNPVKALRGQKVSWEVLELPDGKDSAVVEGSSLDIIPNIYNPLDGIYEDFDIFTQFTTTNRNVALPALSLQASNIFSGGEAGKPNHTILDFSEYNTVDEMDGINFQIDGKNYILTTEDTSTKYVRYNNGSDYGLGYTSAKTTYAMEYISIKGLTVEEAVQKIADKAYSFTSGYTNEQAGVKNPTDEEIEKYGLTDKKVLLKTTYNFNSASDANKETIQNTRSSSPTTKNVVYDRDTVTKSATYQKVTGISNLPGDYLTGGTLGHEFDPFNPDKTAVTAVAPTMDINLSSGDVGKGITITYPDIWGYNTNFMLKFVAGDTAPTNETVTITDPMAVDGTTTVSVVTVGINYKTSSPVSFGSSKYNFTYEMDGSGKLKLTGAALNDNDYPSYKPNSTFKVANGINSFPYYYSAYANNNPAETKEEEFRALKKVKYTNVKDAENAKRATVSLSLNPAEYKNGEDLVDKLSGYELNYPGSGTYKFYDGEDPSPSHTTSNPANGKVYVIKGGEVAEDTTKWIDISPLRNSPTASTLAGILEKNLSLPSGAKITTNGNEIKIPSHYVGDTGNRTNLSVYEGMDFAHYDIDFNAYFASHPNLKLPDDLYGKGFMVYCASDKNQWFNFNFTGNVIEGQDDKPEVAGAPDIKNIFVDISNVKEPAELVKQIEESANPQLAVIHDGHSHYIFTKAMAGSGVLRIYDDRPYGRNADPTLDWQEKGAKISDGLSDYLKKTYTNLYDDLIETIHHEIALNRKEERLIIHDTTKANRDITLHIPRMTLDQMVGVPEEDFDKELFSVMTKDSRDKMLGTLGAEHYADEKGYLDMAIDYLTNANSTIGSQITRLEQAEKNIVTQNETTTASESVIRDADMAKEMTNFTKNNVIAQAAQSMLAQANQTAGGVLELLQ